jgi:hypothetical protein
VKEETEEEKDKDKKSTIALHTTGISLEPSTTEYLNHNAIASALAYLADVWPHLPITVAMREAWTDILCQLHPGELKLGLAQMPSKFRPDPYPLFEKILASRTKGHAKDRHAAEYEATQRHLAEQRDTTPARNEHVASVIAEARKVLGPTHRRTEQRHYKNYKNYKIPGAS